MCNGADADASASIARGSEHLVDERAHLLVARWIDVDHRVGEQIACSLPRKCDENIAVSDSTRTASS